MEQPSLDARPEAWLVYADALQEAGDVRGRLVVLNHAVSEGSDPAARDAYVQEHLAELFGALPFANVEVAWRYAVPESVALRIAATDDGEALAKALLEAPIASWMRRLRVVGVSRAGRVDLAPAIAALATKLPETCTALDLVDERAERARVLVSSDYDPGPNLVRFGPIGAVLSRGLESAHIVTADVEQLDLTGIEAPDLRSFRLDCLRWAPGPWEGGPSSAGEALAQADWPSLQTLALRIPESVTYSWPSNDGAYVPVDRYGEDESEYYDDDGWSDGNDWSAELSALLTSLQQVPLHTLALTSFMAGQSVLQAFVDHGLPETLRVLDLRDSDLANDDLDVILRNNDAFVQLEVLDLRGTFVDDASNLAMLGAEVRVEAGEGHQYQFSVGME